MGVSEVLDGLRTFAGRSASIIGQSASIANLQMKKKDADKRLEEAYSELGKLAYKDLTTEADYSAEIGKQIDLIGTMRKEVSELGRRLEEARAIANESDDDVRAERIALQERRKKARAAAEEAYYNQLNHRS